MERLHYLDFDLKIAREGKKYRASILNSPAGEASISFSLPFSEDRLELLINKLGGGLRKGVRRIDSPEMKTARELGGKLFESVFNGEVYACLKESLDAAAQKKSTGLRIRLRLQDVPELADLPWEFLYHPSKDIFLAQSRKTPIIRYIEMQEAVSPLTVELPLKVLVMISSPSDFECLDVELEKANILNALDPLIHEGKVRIQFMENARLSTLRHLLRKETYHILHFIGHGGFAETIDEGVLILEDEGGKSYQANAHRISTALQDCDSPPRLILLNACEGARASKFDPFASVAATLVRHGTPAVVAMQFAITDHAAITLSSEFYTALAEGLPVDAALAEARNVIYLQPNDVEWGTPVLYMRSADGALFNLTDKASALKKSAVDERKIPVQQTGDKTGAQKDSPPVLSGQHQDQKSLITPSLPPEKELIQEHPGANASVYQNIQGQPMSETIRQTAQTTTPDKPRSYRKLVITICIIVLVVIALYYLPPDETTVLTPRYSGQPSTGPDAVNMLRRAAEQGNPDAQNKLGYLYANGQGVARNDAEAMKWYRKSANQGNMFAQYNLGYMYANGLGVAQNDTVAAGWFRLSAEQGNPAAQYNLGYMNMHGRGMAQNNDAAVYWFRKAALQGYGPAQQILQNMGMGW